VPHDHGPIAVEGSTCWRRLPARRVSFLVDGQAYFTALRSALLKAERQVLILGWDFHRQTRLRPDAPAAEGEQELVDFLHELVKRKKDLELRILDWDFNMLYVLERETMPRLQLDWYRKNRLKRHLDGDCPTGASHHQKIVAIDDQVAFCGGLDLTIRRWDTREHAAVDPRRVDPAGKPYDPFHDVQVVLDGPAAAGLAELARERWRRATKERIGRPKRRDGDAWPDGVAPDLSDVRVGIARTEPAWRGREGVREVERLFVEGVRAAKRSVYIEAQYFTSDLVGDELVRKLEDPQGPEVVIVAPCACPGWVEETALGALRQRLLRRLRASDVHGRLRALYPAVPAPADGERVGVQVHSKVLVVDEAHLHLGSANLSNRSMGLDTECDLAFDADVPRVADAIARFRDGLLAEHLGATVEQVAAVRRETGSLLAVIDRLGQGERTLLPIPDTLEPWVDQMLPDQQVLDPSSPYDADQLVSHLVTDDTPPPGTKRPVARAVAVLGGLLALGLAWQFTPLGDLADHEKMLEWARPLQSTAWGPLIATAAFIAASLVFLPITAMSVAMAVLFGPWIGWVCSLVACVTSSVIGFAVGRTMWHDAVRWMTGPRLDKLSKKLSHHGLVTVIAVRLVPIAPFTVVNLVAGSSHLRFRDFFLGTVIAMAPGLLAMSLVADRVAAAVDEPSGWTIAVAVALLLGLVLLGRWVKRKLAPGDRGDAGSRPAREPTPEPAVHRVAPAG
jgi:phospholipase D1/2